uniref:Uncharacterized protein n=1 Tax=Nelumbo nucifera TaxID=4432 RepID=A0A822ZGZ0_NELNU|nr:TPA_asm: hypothetical protein HUJ06_003604 [Nelumbo nucifera]
MANFFGCFFFVLLVLSVASMFPSSDAAYGGPPCVAVQPLGSAECNIRACMTWCYRAHDGHGDCRKDGDFNYCLCVYNC